MQLGLGLGLGAKQGGSTPISEPGVEASLWTPANLTVAPRFWYKADEIAGIDGATVASLTDASGNGRNTTATAGTPNLETAEQNGLNVIRFQAGENYSIEDMSALTAGSVYAVIKAAAVDQNYGPVIQAGTHNDPYYPFNNGAVYADFGITSRRDFIVPVDPLDAFHIMEFRSGSAFWCFHINGQLNDYTAGLTVGFTNVPKIACGGLPNSNNWLGMLGEMCFLGYVPTTDEGWRLQGYHAHKWGTAGDLPTLNPYKSAAPTQSTVGSDPDFASVKLLVGPSYDVDGSGFIVDDSRSKRGLATIVGQSQIDTGVVKFLSSLQFDGTGDYISYPDSADWILAAANSDPYAIECWVRFAAVGASIVHLAGQHATGLGWKLFKNASDEICFSSSNDGASFNVNLVGTAVIINTWYFIRVDHDAAGKLRLYQGTSGTAVMTDSETPADSTIANVAEIFTIGGRAAGESLNGRIEDVRVTKGSARGATDAGISIPTARFPRF